MRCEQASGVFLYTLLSLSFERYDIICKMCACFQRVGPSAQSPEPRYERREAPISSQSDRDAECGLLTARHSSLLRESQKEREKKERREARREVTYGGTKGNPSKNCRRRGWTPQPLRLEVGDGLWLNYGRLNTKPYGFKAACDPRRVVEIVSRSSLSSGVCMDAPSTCRAARHRADGRRGTSGDAGCSRGPLVK